MNIRSVLLFSTTLIIGNMNAGLIRDRLEQQKTIADAQAKQKAKYIQEEGYSIGTDPRLLPRRITLEIYSGYQLAIRSELLKNMLDCIEHNTNSDEQQATNECYCELSDRLKHRKYMNQAEKELTQQEYEKIGNKDLRQSWFWWLP